MGAVGARRRSDAGARNQCGWLHRYLSVDGAAITLVPIPARCSELNPAENLWRFMRDNWLSNRVLGSCEEIVDHCCGAWNKLADQTWRIVSPGRREWTKGF